MEQLEEAHLVMAERHKMLESQLAEFVRRARRRARAAGIRKLRSVSMRHSYSLRVGVRNFDAACASHKRPSHYTRRLCAQPSAEPTAPSTSKDTADPTDAGKKAITKDKDKEAKKKGKPKEKGKGGAAEGVSSSPRQPGHDLARFPVARGADAAGGGGAPPAEGDYDDPAHGPGVPFEHVTGAGDTVVTLSSNRRSGECRISLVFVPLYICIFIHSLFVCRRPRSASCTCCRTATRAPK